MISMKNLDNIAREIVDYDFSGVDPDDTGEACYLLAQDIYELDNTEAEKVVEIIMDKYVQLIE